MGIENSMIGYGISDNLTAGEETYCPVCGESCEEFCIHGGEIIGCENCTKLEYAADYYFYKGGKDVWR